MDQRSFCMNLLFLSVIFRKFNCGCSIQCTVLRNEYRIYTVCLWPVVSRRGRLVWTCPPHFCQRFIPEFGNRGGEGRPRLGLTRPSAKHREWGEFAASGIGHPKAERFSASGVFAPGALCPRTPSGDWRSVLRSPLYRVAPNNWHTFLYVVTYFICLNFDRFLQLSTVVSFDTRTLLRLLFHVNTSAIGHFQLLDHGCGTAFRPTYGSLTLPSTVSPGVKDVFVWLTETPAPTVFVVCYINVLSLLNYLRQVKNMRCTTCIRVRRANLQGGPKTSTLCFVRKHLGIHD